VLSSDFQASRRQYFHKTGNPFRVGLLGHGGDFLSVSAEDVVLAAAKVRVDLTREERVFGDVGIPRVLR